MEFSKEQLKAIKALQAAEKSSAWNRVSAYVIIAPIQADDDMHKGSIDVWKKHGKIKVLFPASGIGSGQGVKVFVWQCLNDGLQYATGYNLDKAMASITFDGITLKDDGSDWRRQLEEHGYTVIQAI